MRLSFKLSVFLVLCILLNACNSDLIVNLEKELVYIYCTPSTESSDLYISVNKAGNFHPENPTFDDLVYKDAAIKIINLRNQVRLDSFDLIHIGELHGFTSDSVTIFRTDVPDKFFNEGDEIEINVDLEGETILSQVDRVPQKPKIIDFEVSRVPNLPLKGYEGPFPQDSIVQVSFILNNSPFSYYRLEVFKLHKTTGEWVKTGPSLQQQDKAFVKNGITDINPNAPNPVQRYTITNFNNNWIYNAMALDISDETKLIGHFQYNSIIDGSYYDLIDRHRIILTPLKKEIFEVELYSLLEYSKNLYTERKPYPNNLESDPNRCIGSYQITNPIVISK